jgi:protocatechuate 3,4-dioxygenase beta subunit
MAVKTNLKTTCGIVLPVVVALAAWAQPATPATARPSFRVSGRVLNALNGQPLARAAVILGPAQGAEPQGAEPSQGVLLSQRVLTGDDGSFEFDGLAPGKYSLVGQAHGFARQGWDEHEGYFTAVVVGPNLQSEGLVFRLRPDASVSGTITDEQNEAVRGAQVMLFRARLENGQQMTRMQAQTLSNDLGRYRFGHLLPGTYFVAVASHPWYAQGSLSSRRREGLSTQGQGQEPSTGAVAQDASQTTQSQETQSQETQKPTEPIASPLDVAYPVTFWVGTTDVSQASPIILTAGDRTLADVVLTAVPALHLRIKGVNGDPTQGYSANLVEHLFDGSIIQVSGESSRTGNEIEITGVPPGQVEVNFESFGKNSVSWSQPLDLANDTEISAAEGFVSPQISGEVQLDGGAVPEGASIALLNRLSNVSVGARLGPKGEFQIEDSGVKPGAYTVLLNAPGAIVRGVSASGAKVVGQEVEISGGGPIHLVVRASQKLGQVAGTALRAGKPEGGAMVVLVPLDPVKDTSLIRRDQSDSDGTFTLASVLPGRYTVVAIADGWDLEWMSPAVLKPYLKDGETVNVTAGGKSKVQVKVQ